MRNLISFGSPTYFYVDVRIFPGGLLRKLRTGLSAPVLSDPASIPGPFSNRHSFLIERNGCVSQRLDALRYRQNYPTFGWVYASRPLMVFLARTFPRLPGIKELISSIEFDQGIAYNVVLYSSVPSAGWIYGGFAAVIFLYLGVRDTFSIKKK